jgi:hypothetical protein
MYCATEEIARCGQMKCLVGRNDKWQQSQVTRSLDRARQLALASGTIAGLTTRFDFSRLADKPLQCIDIFVVKTLAWRAVVILSAPHPACPAAS